jgi:hypothetical protein
MRRAYLDFTGDFARTVGLDWLPRSWQVVGSVPSPYPKTVRLVLENPWIEGPDALMTIETSEDNFRRLVTVVLYPMDMIDTGSENSREEMSPVLNGTLDCTAAPVAPAPVRFFLASDESGHRYAVPVERHHDFDEWLADADAIDPPSWALRIEGGFTFTDPWQR